MLVMEIQRGESVTRFERDRQGLRCIAEELNCMDKQIEHQQQRYDQFILLELHREKQCHG